MGKLNINTSKAVAEIRKLVTELNVLKKASKGFANASTENFKKIESSITSLQAKVGLIANKLNYLEAIMKKNSAAVNKNTTANAKNTGATKKNVKQKNASAKATKASTKANKALLVSIRALAGAFGLISLVQIVKDLVVNVYDNIKTFDSLGFTLEKITKNSFDFENSQRFLLRITKAYGVELVATTRRWSRFLAAAQNSGLALRDTENIFASMTKAAGVLGLKTDELSSVYLALEQMLSKGKVTTEELRRQLGERLPGAMGIMASSMGVTIPVLDKMLKKGQVLSAEVLPDFAIALERAYGIQNVERIETLVAKQNRLTLAWQTFIKNVSEGNSVLKSVFGGLITLLTISIDNMELLFRTAKQQARLDIIVEEEKYLAKLENIAKKTIEFTTDINNTDANLDFQEGILLEQLKGSSGDVKKQIKLDLEDITRIRADKDKQAVDQMKAFANDQVAIAFKAFQKTKDDYSSLVKFIAKENEKEQPSSGAYSSMQKSLKLAQDDINKAEAEYNILRKLVDESDIKIIDDGTTKKTKRRLREIKDYTLQTINDIAEAVKDANKERADDEDLNLKERLEALKKANEVERFILSNKNKIAIQDIEDKFIKEKKSVDASLLGGRLGAQEATDYIKRLEDEKTSHILLKNTQLSTDLIALNKKTAEESNVLQIDVSSDAVIANIKDAHNQRIIAAKDEFMASKKTNQDRQKLDRELSESAWEMTNDIIDAYIVLKEAQIDNLEILQGEAGSDIHSEAIKKLFQEIETLRAGKKVEPPIDEKEWAEVFQTALDLAADFANAIGDFTDALFARKIENINAEIDAETKKYDKLIELAEGDEEQQKTLENNKEVRIKKLERERLKQEQKQAKAKKKFAIANIAINTAQAIMQIWGNSPDFTGISQGLLTAIIAGIGLAQIAAVVAAPIPQFKDGVTNLNRSQKAMINDGSYKEYIERNGRILSTDKKNAIVDLKKGDTVYKDYADMTSKSSLFKIKNIRAQERYNNDKLLTDVTKAIVTGYAKAKSTTKVNVNNVVRDNGYKESLSMWN